jgi:hypothetical protein
MILNDLNILMATKKPKIWKFENLVNLSLTIVNVYEYLMSEIVKKKFKIQKLGRIENSDLCRLRTKSATV